MNGKILLAALVVVSLLAYATPALAQCGACGAVSYGAPQNCVATVSCNVPVTQMVPYMTSNTVMQPVSVPQVVPVQSSVTVPTAVIVPQQVPVTTYATTCVQSAVPVQVPSTAYAPVTSYVPQVYTMPLSCGAANVPAGGISKAGNAGGLAKGANTGANIGGLSKASNSGMSK